ncbi:MAG: hypothetical protein IJP27_04190, partial [Clostridia bacterium]|nr:hypothetical protein [Clostridia bacterium]
MSLFRCHGRDCTAVGVVIALIVGIITAFLRYTAVITVTPAFLWVTLGIAVVYLAILLAVGPREGCGNPLTALLAGILGTALFSLILLGVSFAATSVIGAIFTGALLFFLALILLSAACY